MANWVVFEIDSSLIVGHNNVMSRIKAGVQEGKYRDSEFCVPNGFIKHSSQTGKIKLCMLEQSFRRVSLKSGKYIRMNAKEIKDILFKQEAKS